MSHSHVHAHSHGHHYHENGGKDVAQANQEFFDELAPTMHKTQWMLDLSRQATEYLQSSAEWMGLQTNGQSSNVKLLDYACGSGVVSRALAPYVGVIRGIDLSEGMLKEFRLEAGKAGYSSGKMSAVKGDILAPSSPNNSPEINGPEFQNFNLATIGYALHHVESPQEMVHQLAERLGPAGTLVVIDFVREGAAEAMGPYAPHNGFTEEGVKELYRNAGLSVNWGWKLFPEKHRIPLPDGGETWKQAFLARGTKSSAAKDEL